MITLTGGKEINDNLRKSILARRKALRLALNSVMAEMVTFIKQNAPWIDRTGNLRNSITYKKAVSQGSRITGVILAGAEYAIYVEYTPGYWVISGALNEYHGKILSLVASRSQEFLRAS